MIFVSLMKEEKQHGTFMKHETMKLFGRLVGNGRPPASRSSSPNHKFYIGIIELESKDYLLYLRLDQSCNIVRKIVTARFPQALFAPLLGPWVRYVRMVRIYVQSSAYVVRRPEKKLTYVISHR
ncbi:unnamed protein product [Amoebophrya sp. A120]|nr:unnamed protein product [Amoebophrya sp. A120]|eukprot:GSA120T00021127001.1